MSPEEALRQHAYLEEIRAQNMATSQCVGVDEGQDLHSTHVCSIDPSVEEDGPEHALQSIEIEFASHGIAT